MENFRSKLQIDITLSNKGREDFCHRKLRTSQQTSYKNGVQITYMGKPILEHSFKNVETYEKNML